MLCLWRKIDSVKGIKMLILKKKLLRTMFYTGIILLAIIWLIPVFFVALTALKTQQEFFGQPIFSLPQTLHWQNFINAWNQGNLSMYMRNGLIISLLKVPLGILIASLAAFFITRVCKVRTGNIIFVIFLVGMMIPMQVTLIPLNIAMSRLNLINTFFGLFLVYIGFGLPFGILVMRGFIRTIPKDLDEAALIDGCSLFRLFWNIILPLTKPALATLMILDFLATWNEFMLASILITDNNMRTVPTGLMSFVGQFSTDFGLLNAGVLISVIPVLIVYLLLQKFFVQGLAGSVKG